MHFAELFDDGLDVLPELRIGEVLIERTFASEACTFSSTFKSSSRLASSSSRALRITLAWAFWASASLDLLAFELLAGLGDQRCHHGIGRLIGVLQFGHTTRGWLMASLPPASVVRDWGSGKSGWDHSAKALSPPPAAPASDSPTMRPRCHGDAARDDAPGTAAP